MALLVRAVYEQGMLRLLDEIELSEGQAVEVMIQPKAIADKYAALREAFQDLTVRWPDSNANPHPEIEGEWDEIYQSLEGTPPLSEIIIEDRGEI